MYKKIKSLAVNISLSFAALLLFFMVLELIVFRFFLVAPDIPIPYFANDVIRYKPVQEGFFRVKNEIKAKFHINSNGWNSNHNEYRTTKNSNKYRIAIIGDSYIEALQVDYNKSVAEQLEANLKSINFEIYRFGISGAPLSQYLHMLRKEVLRYNPDLVIVNVVHNDFNESYEFQPGVYSSSFMKLKVKDSAVTEELHPKQYETPWYNWIRVECATWRYLVYRQQVRLGVLRGIILGKKGVMKKYQANIDISKIKEKAKKNRVITEYIFQEFKRICDSKGISLLILIDGDRINIYKDIETNKLYDKGVLQLNKMAASVAAKHNIEFLDMHNIFREDYLNNKKSFNFVNDGHWNSYAHELVANSLTDYIRLKIKPPTAGN